MGIGFLLCMVIGMVLMLMNAHWPPDRPGTLRRILWLMMGGAGVGAVLFLQAMS